MSDISDEMEEDSELETGKGYVDSDTSPSLTNPHGIKGNRPSGSRLINDPIRSDIAGEDSAVKPKRSSPRFGSKRLAESGLNDCEIKKKKKVLYSAEVATLTPDAGEIGGEKRKLSGAVQRIWSEEDEVAILKGVHEFRAKTGSEPGGERFLEFMKDSISFKASKTQLMDKIRQLKKKFLANSEKLEIMADLAFTDSHEAVVFELSKKLWGKTESHEHITNDCNADGNETKLREARRNKNLADSAEPETVTEKALTPGLQKLADTAIVAVAKDKAAGETRRIPEWTEDSNVVRTEKENNRKAIGGGNDADPLYPYLMEALEEMVTQRILGVVEKKIFLENTRFSEYDDIKEFAKEWKAFRFDEMMLNCKRLHLLEKLSERARNALKDK